MTSAAPQSKTPEAVTSPDWQSLRQQVRTGERGLAFGTFNELWTFCQHVAKAKACPPHYQDKPHDLLMAIQFGAELGLSGMASVFNVVVVKGNVSLKTNMMLGLCYRSTLFVTGAFEQRWEGKPYDDSFRAICTVQRKGATPVVRDFSVAMAKRANLWDRKSKTGEPMPWSQYPDWMLMYRATSAALRTAFADVLLGLYSTEEMQIDKTIDALDLGDEDSQPAPVDDMAQARKRLTKKLDPTPAPRPLEETWTEGELPPAQEPAEPPETEDKPIGIKSNLYVNIRSAFDDLSSAKRDEVRAQLGIGLLTDIAKWNQQDAGDALIKIQDAAK